eukprot:4043982-Alexandrium_andersonii.AAC.1
MSASLVGSEMCIRDRGALSGRACGGTGAGRATEARRRPGRGRDAPWSVSYTHLTLPTICSV